MNFQRSECVFHQRQAWVKLQLAFQLLWLNILQLYHLPPLLPPPVSNSPFLFTRCQNLWLSCCTGLLSKVLYSKIKNVFLILEFAMYYLYKTYCKLAAVATAAKSPQSCPTLCDPIDGSPPGSPVPGILKAKTLKWIAISFSNVWKWKVKVKVIQSCLTLCDSMDCTMRME